VTIFRKEFADGNVALLCGHSFGSDPPTRLLFFSCHNPESNLLFMTDNSGPDI